ncbi:MAG: Gfo/Idh/MocA family oxidoreductase [bacterium]|nr:Gfo/Idh/MocA family oxidoreductase [bacterium]
MRDLLADRQPRHAQLQLFYSGKHIRYWTSRFELCGGSFVENSIHTVDLLRFFLGDIQKVSAFYVYREPGEGPEPINLPHVYNANFQFQSGVVANATTSRVLTNVSVSRRALVIVSDDSLIEWSADKVVENGETVWEREGGERENAFANQARAFVAAVRAGDPDRVRSPYGEALNSLAAVLGANVSAERGGEVLDLGEFAS